MNYKMMGKFLSQILIVEAGFMVPALLISLYTGSRAAVYGFGLSILITAGVGALMYYFCRNSTRRFFAREGMVCVAGSWIAISFFGCLPFVFSREIPNFVDALFEIVSGFTTTGSSILGDVEALSPGIMYWRSFSPWLGGVGGPVSFWGYLYFFWHFLRTEREAKGIPCICCVRRVRDRM